MNLLRRVSSWWWLAACLLTSCNAVDGEPASGAGAGASRDVPAPDGGFTPASADVRCEPGPCACDDERIGRGSCDDDGEPVCDCSALMECVPGEVLACECEGGGMGTARCNDAGDRIGACACEPHFAESGYRLPPELACLIEQRCSGCHGAALAQDAPMPLVTWEDFHAPTPSQPEIPLYLWVGDRAGRDDALRMPPPGSRALSGLDQDAIVAWVEQGAPPAMEPPEGPRDGPADDAIPGDVLAVLQVSCFRCHGEQPIGGAIKLTTIDDWFQRSPLYDPTRQVWQVAAERIQNGEMPQGSVLAPTSVVILTSWLDAEPPDCSPVQ